MRAFPAQLQAEYDELQRRRPSRLALLASKRVAVLPDWALRLYGGAAVLYRWTCVSRSMLDAPADIRRALLAHEWGHIARGHYLAALAALILLLAYITSPSRGGALIALLLLAPVMLWLIHPRREDEADDVAVELVGVDQYHAALTWAVQRSAKGKPGKAVLARLERLKGMSAR